MFTKLIKWSADTYSFLPWRRNRTLYTTLVSEIMLQQTTVGTVLNHFEKFIKRFPDLESLANATDEQLTIEWKGLGYYRRARNLKKAAEFLINQFNGDFPIESELLKSIPGIGEYTAHALISIGMNRPALAVDANLERVIERFYGVKDNSKENIKKLFIEKKIFSDVSKNKFRELNEALMDLGRTICQANKVQCEICPLKQNCEAYISKKIIFKRDKKDKVKQLNLKLLRVVVLKENKILVYKKEKGEWLEGQYEVPTFIIESDDSKLKQYDLVKNFTIKNEAKFKSVITKYKIENIVILVDEVQFHKKIKVKNKFLFKKIDFQNENFATSVFKCLKNLKEKNQEKV